MADSQYPYPPDRFDDEADAVAFHGAHRAEEPFWRQNLVYIVIIAAAFVLLLVLLFLIGGMGQDGDDRAEDPTTSAASESSEEASEDGEDEEDAEEESAPEPDLSTPVLIVNAGGITGLAGTWQETLQDQGWEEVYISTADNIQQESVVFYRDEADADSAQALAEESGAGEARQSDEYDARITIMVVSEPDDGEDDEG